MVDQKTLDRIKLMHPKLRDEVSEIYAEICKALTGKSFCRFTYTLRTFKEQDELYAKGRTAPGSIVTNAKGGMSWHNYGMAVDIVLIRDGNALWDVKKDLDGDGKSDWMEVVQIFKEYGWEAGIDWKFIDPPHFQKTLGYTINQMHKLYIDKKIDKNGYVIID